MRVCEADTFDSSAPKQLHDFERGVQQWLNESQLVGRLQDTLYAKMYAMCLNDIDKAMVDLEGRLDDYRLSCGFLNYRCIGDRTCVFDVLLSLRYQLSSCHKDGGGITGMPLLIVPFNIAKSQATAVDAVRFLHERVTSDLFNFAVISPFVGQA